MLVILGFMLGVSSSSTAATGNRFPVSMPSEARAAFQTAGTTTPVVPNVFINISMNPSTGEWSAYAEHYDASSEYGWTPCQPGECGAIIKDENGNGLVQLLSTEQRLGAYLSYASRNGKTYGGLNWNGDTVRIHSVMKWFDQKRYMTLSYGSVSVYSDKFASPPPYTGGK